MALCMGPPDCCRWRRHAERVAKRCMLCPSSATSSSMCMTLVKPFAGMRHAGGGALSSEAVGHPHTTCNTCNTWRTTRLFASGPPPPVITLSLPTHHRRQHITTMSPPPPPAGRPKFMNHEDLSPVASAAACTPIAWTDGAWWQQQPLRPCLLACIPPGPLARSAPLAVHACKSL